MSNKQGKLTLKWYNSEEGEEEEYDFPSKNEVCSRCEGYGTHLNPSIGEHAYTMQEFNDSFDEEEREQYFKRGGIYDVTCEGCDGNKVVQVVDEGALCTSEKEVYAIYESCMEERARANEEDRKTRYYESGGYY